MNESRQRLALGCFGNTPHAMAIVCLTCITKFGWPAIRNYFDRGLQSLEQNTDDVTR